MYIDDKMFSPLWCAKSTSIWRNAEVGNVRPESQIHHILFLAPDNTLKNIAACNRDLNSF